MLLMNRDQPAIDYSHRHVPGGPSTVRIAEGGRSLLEEVFHVEAVANSRNPPTEITTGLQVHRIRALPERSLRESILNAVCHRDWTLPGPTVVEHIGHHFRVTSPGGLIGGVTKDNIITHPSTPRYRTLATAMRKIGLVEQEGVGVDLMFAEMIRTGGRPPLIETLPDPAVRVVLFGGRANETWYKFFVSLVPRGGIDDVDIALLVWWASRKSLYLTVRSCAALLQRSYSDAEESLLRAASFQFKFQPAPNSRDEYATGTPVRTAPVVVPIKVPRNTPPAWRLSVQARSVLGQPRSSQSAESAVAWAEERGRISSGEYCEMTGVSPATAIKRLKDLVGQGLIVPSSESGRGRGFHYRPA